MGDPAQIAMREEKLLAEIRDRIEEHDPTAAERLTLLHPSGGVPTSVTMPDEFAAFLAEAIAVLYRKAAPRKRGRPRKADKAA